MILKYFLAVYILLFFCGCGLEANKEKVVIQGYLEGFKKGDSINYYLPIDGFSNFKIYNTTAALNDSGFFIIESKLDSTGFIKIQGKNNRVYILASKGDKIFFKENAEDDKNKSKFPVVFKGANAAGMNVYNKINRNLMDKFDYTEGILKKKFDHGCNFYDSMIIDINLYLKPFTRLYNSKEITDEFYNIVMTDLRSVMLSHLLKNIQLIKENNAWIDDKIMDDIRNIVAKKMFEKAINTDPYLLHTNWGSVMINDFIHEHDKLFKNNEYPISDLFFYKHGGKYTKSSHLSNAWNYFTWGGLLLTEASFRPNEFNFDSAFTYYKLKYPNSSFIKVVEDILKNQQGTKTFSFSTDSTTIKILDSSSQFKSIVSIINSKFKDKPVFIDLWATWCLPCKQEFQFKKPIETLLKTLNIEMLYISIDDEIYKKKWHNDIYQLGLSGNHIIAGADLQKDISNIIYNDDKGKLSIPRYVLINKKGLIVNKNLPRPSNYNDLKAILLNEGKLKQ